MLVSIILWVYIFNIPAGITINMLAVDSLYLCVCVLTLLAAW